MADAPHCAIAVGHRITAHTASRRTWRSGSVRRAKRPRAGGRECSGSGGSAEPRPSIGPPRAQRAICWRAAAWSRSGGAAGPTTIRGVVAPVTHAPNDLWTADFQGHFRTRDGGYCYPLTIADLHTRYLLTCQGLLSTKGLGVRARFEQAFRAYCLPRAIRTDNGVPFATTGIHGLSQLNVWWMRLGIQHQRIRPASPQENGAHERMHRTLKREATRPAAANRHRQQVAFDRFRAEYNEDRPHEAL